MVPDIEPLWEATHLGWYGTPREGETHSKMYKFPSINLFCIGYSYVVRGSDAPRRPFADRIETTWRRRPRGRRRDDMSTVIVVNDADRDDMSTVMSSTTMTETTCRPTCRPQRRPRRHVVDDVRWPMMTEARRHVVDDGSDDVEPRRRREISSENG